jgi:4-amino-4-deoxy-L-arabinose transferase-like glycosyltransferase
VIAISSSRARRWLPWLIVLVAFVVRIGYSAAIGLDRPLATGSDDVEYDTYAWNLAQGHGYRGMSPDVADQDHLTAYRSPGPSLLYAGVYLVAGHRPDVVRVVNCALAAIACLLIILIGQRCFGELTGLIAGAIWSVWPMSILLSGTLASESIALLALLGFVMMALQFADAPSVRGALFAGALLGINLVVHPSRLFLLPFVAVWALVQFRRSYRTLALAALVPMIAALVLSPWIIRNEHVFGRFIPLSTMGGSSLLQGNNRIVATDPEYLGYNVWDTAIPEYADALRAPNNEIARDSVAKHLATSWIKAHRDRWIPMVIAKLRRGWTPFLQPHTARSQRLVMLISWGPILLLALIGFIPWLLRFLRAGDTAWLLHLVILHIAAINAVFFGYARYRYVVEPYCILIAVASAIWLFERRRARPLLAVPLARARG